MQKDKLMRNSSSVIRIATSPGRIRAARFGPLLYLLLPVGFFTLMQRVEGGFFGGRMSDGIFVFLVILVGVGFIGPVLIAILLIRRVPRDARDGYIEISPQGVDFRVGPHHANTRWTEVGAVHPILREMQRFPAALWLSRSANATLNPARVLILRKLLAHRIVVPAVRDDGVLLPLELFSNDDALRIVQSAQSRFHARKTDYK